MEVFTYDSKEEILFISDDHFYINYNSKYSNKYLDPIFEELSRNFKCRKLHLDSKILNKKNIISYQIKTRPNSEEIKIENDIFRFSEPTKRRDTRNIKYKNINVENLSYILKRKLEDINEGRNFIEDMKVKPKYIFYSSYALPFKIGINIASKLHKLKLLMYNMEFREKIIQTIQIGQKFQIINMKCFQIGFGPGMRFLKIE